MYFQISSQCSNTISFSSDIMCTVENVVFTSGSIEVAYTLVIELPNDLAGQVSGDVRMLSGAQLSRVMTLTYLVILF